MSAGAASASAGAGTTLESAISSNNIDAIKAAISVPGFDINAQNTSEDTPLLYAVRNNAKESVAFLLTVPGINVNLKIGDIGPIHLAIFSGFVEILSLLLGHPDININAKGFGNNSTPLHLACIANTPKGPEAAQMLLTLPDININTTNMSGNTALILACSRNIPNPELVAAILEYPGGKDGIDIANLRGETALMHAVYHQNLSVISSLLAVPEIDVNKMTEDGTTALSYAVKTGKIDIVNLLLAVPGIDVNKGRAEGIPLIAAIRLGNIPIITALCAVSGINVNFESITIRIGTPMMYTISFWRNYPDVVSAILAAIPGIDINKQVRGESPLFFAIAMNLPKIVKLLLALPGIQVNNIEMGGKTCLYHAAEIGSKEIVSDLQASGASVDLIVPAKGKSVKQLAQEGTFSPEINELISPPAPLPAESEAWKGFTKGDIEKLHTIFDTEIPSGGGKPPAEDWSLCPICLNYMGRIDGCKYMKHDCRTNSHWYHKKLYKKFKDAHNMISWCTICGRVCHGHKHYKLEPFDTVPATLVEIAPVTDTAVFFTDDCKGREGGGGIDEKLLRFRRFAEVAKELNEEVGEITMHTALTHLVEQMWNAPLSTVRPKHLAAIRSAKNFNTAPLASFPSNSIRNEKDKDETIDFSFNRSSDVNTNAKIFPVGAPLSSANGTVSTAENAIGFADSGNVIYFRHKQLNGTMRDHYSLQEGIGQTALIDYITESLKSFGTDPHFGMCPFYASGCNALLFPSEIKEFVPPELYTRYFTAFNRIYAQRKAAGLEGYTLEATATKAVTGGAGAASGMAGGRRHTITQRNRNRDLKKTHYRH